MDEIDDGTYYEVVFKKITKYEWLAAALLAVIFAVGTALAIMNYKPAKGTLTLDNYEDFVNIKGSDYISNPTQTEFNAYFSVSVQIPYGVKYEIENFSVTVLVSAVGGVTAETITLSGHLKTDCRFSEDCTIHVKKDPNASNVIPAEITIQSIEGDYYHV